uniref:NADP-dependent oxidoreductase domain-containing protein n=1 Tax=Panagrolaimus superbus TaxID=310955 RepID=A0A914YQG3_9BILA
MIHFPTVPEEMGNSKEVLEETWRELEKLYDNEKIRALGVSNFCCDDLENLLEICSIRPHIIQSEFHPCQNPAQLRQLCDEVDITFCGYCPLAKGRILHLDQIAKIAKNHKKTPAQICIRWSIQNGVCAIPKSRKPVRIMENSLVFDFELTEAEMYELNNLHLKESLKVVNLSSIQERMDLPDGYKL